MPILGKMYVWGERAKHIPEEGGVYALYDKDRCLVYLGGSANLRETFTGYLETDFSDDHRKRKTIYYKREFTPTWKERVKDLLDEYSKEYGEPPTLNILPELPKKEVSREWGFYFYEDVGRPTFEAAFNLDDFFQKVRKVPIASLEFHQKRGDFARWIRDVFKELALADRIANIYSTGEDLRRELLSTTGNPENAECPECGTKTRPAKTWKMAGRPSRSGERLQLTIGLYKCSNCEKTFRKALKKERIRQLD